MNREEPSEWEIASQWARLKYNDFSFDLYNQYIPSIAGHQPPIYNLMCERKE